MAAAAAAAALTTPRCERLSVRVMAGVSDFWEGVHAALEEAVEDALMAGVLVCVCGVCGGSRIARAGKLCMSRNHERA